MNEVIPSSLQREIDRLVGGDLTKTESRQFVARLDADPAAWKQCALAYMEAQSWREAFESMLDRETKPAPQTIKATRTLRASGSLMATAAAVVVAFVAGIGAMAAWQASFAERPTANDVATGANRDAKDRGKNAAKRQATPNSDDPLLVGVVNITNNGETEAAFPLVAAKDNALVSIELTSDQLNDYNRQLWERRGYRIEQYRKLVSVALADGSRFRFPVDWVQYRYVGERVY
jgi:anti-sigma factor RsiW